MVAESVAAKIFKIGSVVFDPRGDAGGLSREYVLRVPGVS